MNCCCSAKTKRKFFRKPRNAGGHYFLYFFCSCPGTSIQSFFQPARWLCTISVIRQAKEREVVHKHYVSLQVRHIPVTGRHLNVAHFEDQLRLPNADPDTMPLGDLLVLSRGAAQRPSVRPFADAVRVAEEIGCAIYGWCGWLAPWTPGGDDV